MKRFCVVLLLPLLLANACEVRPLAPRPDWEANNVDQARLVRLSADPWLRPEQSVPGGTTNVMHPGGGGPVVLRPNTKRWSEESVLGDPYGALAAEIGAAQQAGWFVTGVSCSHGDEYAIYDPGQLPEESDPGLVSSPDRIVVGFAKPADDLDHAEAAYLLEGLRARDDSPTGGYSIEGEILVAGVAPHHADRGWPKYVPIQLSDTCIADPHRPLLFTKEKGIPKTNPPPPQENSEEGPLDQAGKPFAKWDDSSRFDSSALKKPASNTPATPST